MRAPAFTFADLLQASLGEADSGAGWSFDTLSPHQRAHVLTKMGAEGLTHRQIAQELGRNVNSIGSDIFRARQLLGQSSFPSLPKGFPVGTHRRKTALDQLVQVGDTVVLDLAQEGSRQNIYQNAETRGLIINLRRRGGGYEATLVGLAERLTFDKLVGLSDPKGFARTLVEQAKIPAKVLQVAQALLDEVRAEDVGDHRLVDGYVVETHTLGCREAADTPKENQWEEHWAIFDEYSSDGFSTILGDPADGKFVTISAGRSMQEGKGSRLIFERLTFDKLVGLSDPKRITRSATVRVPPLKFDAYKDQEAYYFNVKSSPSTTGLRHKGMIKVFKPKDPNTPLEKCECVVDCGCPDYKYRWAWSNKQRGSGLVGPDSLNQAWNQAPRITNPKNRPGCCKHILACRDYIYGQFRSFASEQEYDTTTSKLDRMVKQSQKRWADFPGEVAKAKERDQAIQQSIRRATELKAQAAKNPWLIPQMDPSKLPDPFKREPEVPSAEDIHDLADRKGIPWDYDPAFMAFTRELTGKELISDLSAAERTQLFQALEQGQRPPAAAPKGSVKAAASAKKSGADSVAAWRAARSEESQSARLVSNGMPTSLIAQMDRLVEDQAELEGTLGTPGSSPQEEESESMKLLREIRDIVRHLAGDDLPPDLTDDDSAPLDEPGIPVDATRSRE